MTRGGGTGRDAGAARPADGRDTGVGDDTPSSETQSAANRLFDLRELIAGVFLVFGVVLIIAGILDGPAQLAKASGVRINLWVGIGMVVLAGVFVAWRYLRPLRREDLQPTDDDEAAGPPAH